MNKKSSGFANQTNTIEPRCVSSAKINLALHVTGQRADGLHLLESIVCFTEFGDRINIILNPTGSPEIALVKSGQFADCLCDDGNNLVIQAANLLREELIALNYPCPGVTIHLKKLLPIASGMGGGSGNAAATLRLLKEIWVADNPRIDLLPIAKKLGADVAMCMSNAPKTVSGIGDNITAFELDFSIPIVLVNCHQEVSTPIVFQRLENKTNPEIKFDTGKDLFHSLKKLRNDLQPVAIEMIPEIKTVLDVLNGFHNCKLARMTGSGATCFGLFDSFDAAQSVVKNINDNYPRWWAIATHTIASKEVDHEQH